MAKELDEGTLAIIEKTARDTAEHMMEIHLRSCPINELKLAVFGNGTDAAPGIKTDVIRLDNRVKTIETARSLLRDIAKPVIASILTAGVLWSLAYASEHDVRAVQIHKSTTQRAP